MLLALLKWYITRDRNVTCMCALGRALLLRTFRQGWKRPRRVTSGMKFRFRSGDKKKMIIGHVFCARFLIAERKNRPNLSVYILLYYNITIRYCDITTIIIPCTAVIMRSGRWSSGGRPSEIIGFLRVGARADFHRRFFPCSIRYYYILFEYIVQHNII